MEGGPKLTCILRIALSYAAEKRCGLCEYEARLKYVKVPDASSRKPGSGKCNMSVVVRWQCGLSRVFVNLHAASIFMPVSTAHADTCSASVLRALQCAGHKAAWHAAE